MTDTNHIEQRARELLAAECDRTVEGMHYDAYGVVTLHVALSAIRRALSARASAEDAGDFASDTAALAFLRLVGNGNPNIERAVKRLHSSLIDRAFAGEGGDGQGEHAYNCGVNDAIVHDCSCGLAAAPQPAQAGASGGGEPFGYYIETLPPKAWECTFTRAPEIAAMQEAAASGRVKVTPLYTTPASPATDHCTCPSETRCAGTCPYYQRLHTTPPAHGDGEGVKPADVERALSIFYGKPWPNGYVHQVQEEARCNMYRLLRTLTTRPTPEAQEARDAVQWAHDEFEDKEHVARVRGDIGLADYYGVCKAKMAAALALPAQGEG